LGKRTILIAEARLMKTLQRLNESERSNSFDAIATTWSNDGGG
jgi:hypothetical protein